MGEEWNFSVIPDDELWAALIWEYGRSAVWIHDRLPRHDISDEVERAKQIGLFHEGRPSAALKLLNKMRLWHWSWSQDHAIQYLDFFLHDYPWETLPPIVRANMCRAIYGLEPTVDLKRLHATLADVSPDDGSKARDAATIMKQIAAFMPPSPTPEERDLINEKRLGETRDARLDDVTISVIKGEEQFESLRQTLDQLLRRKISPLVGRKQLQRLLLSEIRLRRFRDDPWLKQQGYFAVAFRGNFNQGRKELIQEFGKWLDDNCPKGVGTARKGKRSVTLGPDGIVLKSRNGRPVEPAAVLKQLGTWRIAKEVGSAKAAIATYWPKVSGKARGAREVQLSRDPKEVEQLFSQLFPRSQS